MSASAIEIFREFLQAPLDRLVDEAQSSGGRIIGYTCSYVPEPLIGVKGLLPVRLRAPGVSGTPMADTYLSSVLCPYTRSLLEFALEGHYDRLDGWVHAGSCDHLRRLYDNLNYLLSPSFNHIIDLPHKTGGEALDWFEEELRALASALERHFGVDTTSEALLAAICAQNECAEILSSIGELRKLDDPPVSGAEFHTLLVACSAMPKRAASRALIKAADELKLKKESRINRARLLLVGSQMDDPGYIRIIESVGGLVVADRLCSGSIPELEKIEVDGDPLRSLAAHYLRKTSCPRMMEEFNSRLEAILKTAEEYRVDGVVVQTMKFCDCWGVESSPLVEALRGAGVPVLRIEREYALYGEGQLRTRIQAFVESMGK